MTSEAARDASERGEEELLILLAALASPIRLRVLTHLRSGRGYVSQLARDLAVSRPLLHMHLEKLEAAGLVSGHLELSASGKAMKFYELAPFRLLLTADSIADALDRGSSAPAAGSAPPTDLATGAHA